MNRSLLRDLALVVVTGGATPFAFLAPGFYRPRHDLGIVAVDAVLGLVIGAVLAAIIARFTRAGRWTLWLAFAAAFLIAIAVPGAESIAARLGLLVHQPMILFVLCGASVGFCLGPRGSKASAAH